MRIILLLQLTDKSIILNITLHFLQSKQDYQPQNPILHPLRGTQPESNVSDMIKIFE